MIHECGTDEDREKGQDGLAIGKTFCREKRNRHTDRVREASPNSYLCKEKRHKPDDRLREDSPNSKHSLIKQLLMHRHRFPKKVDMISLAMQIARHPIIVTTIESGNISNRVFLTSKGDGNNFPLHICLTPRDDTAVRSNRHGTIGFVLHIC